MLKQYFINSLSWLVILVLRRQTNKDNEFKARLPYIVYGSQSGPREKACVKKAKINQLINININNQVRRAIFLSLGIIIVFMKKSVDTAGNDSKGNCCCSCS